ncbi:MULTISPECIES: fimbrial protein [Providencia]|uniref:Beta-fimbriae putative major subunit n=2 Tax=Providencia heimbachae TaxID=333962 RepID=A0A1B7JKI5_9GAMM|nr:MULTISPECIES: fimbrial protein [Providencia]MBP6121732.1 fimbrial protein [Providencia sp.]MDD9341581.1 fimbrial protein [Providencia heimbachae]NIH22024.1 fimbrial protein [Providencia heimbachae]OAT48411.1 beta-fimbriae putative major subunit [Providencia heimbachae ATCC 35613]QCJ69500.1 fimbrial protein [Providencia heimbachae]
MFKKTIIALSLTFVSSAALSAAPVANLKVVGTIAPPTCSIQGQNEVDFEYVFTISPEMFPLSGNLTVDGKRNNIEVICDAATYLTFSSTDNRADSALIVSNTNFGLGLFDTDKKIGNYIITMKNATVKATPTDNALAVGISNGATYNTLLNVDKTKKLGWATSVSALKAGQVFAADFDVTPTLNAALKSSSGEAKLDGHATLAFAFAL